MIQGGVLPVKRLAGFFVDEAESSPLYGLTASEIKESYSVDANTGESIKPDEDLMFIGAEELLRLIT